MTLADVSHYVHLEPGAGERFRVITDLVTMKATASDSGDAFSIFEVETPPGGGFPAHIQRHDDEGFFVIEGRYTFLIADQEADAGPGSFVLVPRGTVHGHVNPGPGIARMLIIMAPGGITERFFHEVGDDPDRPAWEPDMERVLAVAPKYGIEIMTAGTKSDTW